jgi:FAD/FMN-containing dehydrogenase
MNTDMVHQNSITDLQNTIKGTLITPDHPDYDGARTLFYGGMERRPACVVRVADAEDVAQVINFARHSRLPLAVRGGGHSVAGHSIIDGAIVLDLRNLNSLEIDVKGRTAWAGAGMTAGDYTQQAGAHGLATPFGDTGSVGIGGLTLGGGVGYLVRKHGLTIDALLAAEIVTADGEQIYTDAESHPDLFWAIRGGGGNFGVVTRFKFRLYDVNTIYGGILALPATPDAIVGFIAVADAAPEELSAIATVMKAPPMPFLPPELHGSLVIMAMVCYAGDPAVGEQVMAPFRALATPLLDTLAPIPYEGMYPPEEEAYHPVAASRTMFIDYVDIEVANTILSHIRTSDAMMAVTQLRVLGGAMARVPVTATAFAHRRSRIMANVAALYQNPDDASRYDAWVGAFADALRQSDSGAYVNFVGPEGATLSREVYPGDTWERLRTIKRQYDPTNFFRNNHNIPPVER